MKYKLHSLRKRNHSRIQYHGITLAYNHCKSTLILCTMQPVLYRNSKIGIKPLKFGIEAFLHHHILTDFSCDTAL